MKVTGLNGKPTAGGFRVDLTFTLISGSNSPPEPVLVDFRVGSSKNPCVRTC